MPRASRDWCLVRVRAGGQCQGQCWGSVLGLRLGSGSGLGLGSEPLLVPMRMQRLRSRQISTSGAKASVMYSRSRRKSSLDSYVRSSWAGAGAGLGSGLELG